MRVLAKVALPDADELGALADGASRMADCVDELVETARRYGSDEAEVGRLVTFAREFDLIGRRIVVSAEGTREAAIARDLELRDGRRTRG